MIVQFSNMLSLTVELEDAVRRWFTVEQQSRTRLREFLRLDEDDFAAISQLVLASMACARLCGQSLNEFRRSLTGNDETHSLLAWVEEEVEVRQLFAALDEELAVAELTLDDLPPLLEELLAHRAPALRRRIGAFHTPTEVARFVICETHDALVSCGFEQGLLDESTYADLEIEPPPGLSPDTAVIRVLEPAVGSGVFLRELLRHAVSILGRESMTHARMARLLGRICTYEVLPHVALQCRMLLRTTLFELGYDPALADLVSLHTRDFLSAAVERDSTLAGVSVVLGNPPYARASQHRSTVISKWLACYREGLEGERNLQPLADDYIKFMRAIEVLTEDLPIAVVGLVTNHTYVRGKLHAGMRRSLLKSFDRIAVTDLHGNTKVRTSGARDENVFGISQGVAVSVMVRALGQPSQGVFYRELRGRRVDKLACLCAGQLPGAQHVSRPDTAFAPTESLPREYEAFVSLRDLFEFYSVGGKPGDDRTLVGFEEEQLLTQLRSARRGLRSVRDGTTEAARRLSQRPVERPFCPEDVIRYAYRPFDDRVAYYEPEIWTRPLRALYEHVDGRPILLTTRIVKDERFAHVFVTRRFPDVIALSTTSSVNCYAFPQATLKPERLCSAMGLSLKPEEAFAYIYGALHSEAYRTRYIGGLRQDFPRVPVMRDPALVASLVARGMRLLALHLGETTPKSSPPRFVDGGDRRIVYGVPEDASELDASEEGLRLGLNECSYFVAVPKDAWSYRVGAYQVCRKWLLDRRRAGRELSDDDIRCYCEMVAVVQETRALQSDIDELIERFGGFPDAVCSGSTLR